jgi:hypothetical protein
VARETRAYGLCDIIDDNGAVGVSVVHGRQGLVSFLARGVPYFKFDGRVLVEGDGLSQEGGADSGFAIVVELVFDEAEDEGALRCRLGLQRSMERRRETDFANC